MVKLINTEETEVLNRIDKLIGYLKERRRRNGSFLLRSIYYDSAKTYLREQGFSVTREYGHGSITEFYIRRDEAW